LSGCGNAAGFDVWPDLVGEFGYELSCNGEPANGISFEGESVGVAVSNGLACGLDGNIIRGEELGKGAGDKALQWSEPLRILGL